MADEGVVVMLADVPKALDLGFLGTEIAAPHGEIIAGANKAGQLNNEGYATLLARSPSYLLILSTPPCNKKGCPRKPVRLR